MKKSKTVGTHVWLYFMFFTVSILLLLWTFLIGFMQIYYRTEKTNEMKKAMQYIKDNYNSRELSSYLESLAITNNMCIEITDKYINSIYSYDMMAGRCYIHSEYGAKLFEIRNDLYNSDKKEIYYDIKATSDSSRMLVGALMIGEKNDVKAFVFLNIMLEPIESTTTIIQKQLLLITIAIFSLALIGTIFISKKLSKPIVSITKSAQKFAKGDYSTKFDGGEYLEVQQLAEVLNYAGVEISKVDSLRRELISNVSHDLRTPLTIIKAYAEMIRDLSGDNKEKREKHISVIIDEADRLSKLVNGLLELSKLESGNYKLEYTNFSINDEIYEVLSRYNIYAEQDNYVFEYIKDDDAIVSADKARIEQVLYNFINNAVNYTGDDKKIIIRQVNKQSSVRIEVTDTGMGISQEMLPLIFDRYYRDKKNEREVAGTGLGLSIVKEILRNHGFPFGVISKEGKGSTFWFEINKA